MERKHSKPEINSGKVLVDRAGYISRERRIKNIMRAGANLEAYRRAGYFDIPEDSDIDIDQVQYDPTRQKNFDLADASALKKQIHRKLKEARYVKNTEDEKPDKKQESNGDDKVQAKSE